MFFHGFNTDRSKGELSGGSCQTLLNVSRLVRWLFVALRIIAVLVMDGHTAPHDGADQL